MLISELLARNTVKFICILEAHEQIKNKNISLIIKSLLLQ